MVLIRWQANSPDLNPIENVCSWMKYQLHDIEVEVGSREDVVPGNGGPGQPDESHGEYRQVR